MSSDPRLISSVPRRRFLGMAGGAVGLAATNGCSSARRSLSATPPAPGTDDSPARFDPWVEIEESAFRHNVGEAARLAGGRPILAVVKNNAYGLGDRTVGPMMEAFPEVAGLACVRVEEALAMRDAGVTKPIVVMAVTSDEEMAELVRNRVTPSVWLDDAPRRLERLATRMGRRIPVQLFVDTGMNREGMPFVRARPWIAELCGSASVEVEATYTMFSHDLDFDRVQLGRFNEILSWARDRSLGLGKIHASPTVELFHLPAAHFDMVRPGNALFGNYPSGQDVTERADLRPTFRLRARVVRVERVELGESAGFRRAFMPDRPTWIGLLPVGRTDGYPSAANGTCEVLIGGRLYPVRGGVNSAHAIIEIGEEETVAVGDVATLIGPDHPAIYPHTIADKTGASHLGLIQALGVRLPRRLV